jgi:hypothetical protein
MGRVLVLTHVVEAFISLLGGRPQRDPDQELIDTGTQTRNELTSCCPLRHRGQEHNCGCCKDSYGRRHAGRELLLTSGDSQLNLEIAGQLRLALCHRM